jgi:hypothetical protein
MKTPALGAGDGRTLSVVGDMPEKVAHEHDDDHQHRREDRYDRSLDVLAEGDLKHYRSFEHPWNGHPEFVQRPAQGMDRRAGHGVWTELY